MGLNIAPKEMSERMVRKIIQCGEVYYNITDIQDFIEQCNKRNEVIFSIEFFQIENGKVIPYDALQSIDSVGLYDEEKDAKSNVHVCNSFIEACIKKSSIDMLKLYFNVISEKLEDGG